MKKGKKYVQALELIEKNKAYTKEEAIELVKKTSTTKFDGSVEVAINLNLDTKKTDQQLRGAIVLPNGTGKTKRVLVLTKNADQAKAAKAAGADFVGDDDLVNKIQKENWLDYDIIIATPEMMPALGKLGKVLGPRGLMPNPKTGTVTTDVTKPIEDVKKDSGALWGVLAALGITGGGGVSIFGFCKLLKKRKEKKAAEEIARIENSDLVKEKNETILALQQELENQKNQAERKISSKDSEISYFKSSLKDVREELSKMKERKERAIIAYPDIEEKIDAILLQEKIDADKAAAAKVERKIRSALEYDCTRHNLNIFQTACDDLRGLSYDEEKYVSADLISSIKNAYQKSFDLQKKYEEEERIKKDKKAASNVDKIILAALALSLSRHSLSGLKNAYSEYENLTSKQQSYVTADVNALYDMMRKAKRLQDEYEEEERRRRMNSYSSSSRSSFGGSSFGSHSGMGGSSRGHGGGRKF